MLSLLCCSWSIGYFDKVPLKKELEQPPENPPPPPPKTAPGIYRRPLQTDVVR